MVRKVLSRAVSWETLERIHRAGVVVGSHTASHIVLTNETPEFVHDESPEITLGTRAEIGCDGYAISPIREGSILPAL